jgi:hypothetical protein
MTTELKVQLALVEIQQHQLRARYYEQRIANGVYKERLGRVFHGTKAVQEFAYNEEELCRDEISTMNQHISNAQAHIEYAKGLLFEGRF